jgi:hypothetical protein
VLIQIYSDGIRDISEITETMQPEDEIIVLKGNLAVSGKLKENYTQKEAYEYVRNAISDYINANESKIRYPDFYLNF